MRLQLTFAQSAREQVIPFNYEYLISCWIYKILAKADSIYAGWLHDYGYSEGSKKFKLFTFSSLDLLQYKIVNGKGFRIESNEIKLIISFYIDKALENFIKGLFEEQEMILWRNDIKAAFKVCTVESLAGRVFKDEMSFRCLSPICISRPEINSEGKMIPKYLSPGDEKYKDYFFDNMIRKYAACIKHNGVNATGNEIIDYDKDNFDLEVLSNPRSKLVTVKEGSPHETRFRSFNFKFRINAPAELIEFCYSSGFGEKNSMGMGCVEAVEQ